MSSDLIAFLRARLDEDETVAREATNHTGRWSWDHGYGQMCNDPTCEYGELLDEATPEERVAGTVLMEVHGYDVKEPWQGAAHIARHDPVRVLREVEAKRKLLAAHRPYAAEPDQACLGCAGGIEWEQCSVLRSLAAVYADHPEYRQEWAL